MKPKKKKKAKLTDFERLAPPPTQPLPVQQPVNQLRLRILFDNGDATEFQVNPTLRQELLTRLTPSLDKPTPTFVGFTETEGNDLIILNTAHILSLAVGRS